MASNKKTSSITRTFTLERETKNSVRFEEQGDEEKHAIGKLYVKKSALEKMGNPETLTVIIDAEE